jgi:hypothetical protein
MNDSAAMRFIQRIGNLRAVFQSLIKRQWSFFETLCEGFAFHALHHNVIDAVLMADIVQHADVWVIEAGNSFASRSNRCLAAASAAIFAGKILMATIRSSLRSLAR